MDSVDKLSFRVASKAAKVLPTCCLYLRQNLSQHQQANPGLGHICAVQAVETISPVNPLLQVKRTRSAIEAVELECRQHAVADGVDKNLKLLEIVAGCLTVEVEVTLAHPLVLELVVQPVELLVQKVFPRHGL